MKLYWKQSVSALKFLVLALVLTGLVYSFAVLGISRLFFPVQADGSLTIGIQGRQACWREKISAMQVTSGAGCRSSRRCRRKTAAGMSWVYPPTVTQAARSIRHRRRSGCSRSPQPIPMRPVRCRRSW